jgi:hypothetical protein
MLDWHGGEQKEISLKSKLRVGCVLFVRLLQQTCMVNNVPVAYQAAKVANEESKGRTRVCLAQLKPRKTREATETTRNAPS